MNQNQKIILVAVIVIIMGMLAYPPFQVIARNGIVFNKGYGWIIDPPKRGAITATVNVAMLLIQWVGVLIVGCIAFFLAKTPERIEGNIPEGQQVSLDALSQDEKPKLQRYRHANWQGPAGVGGWLLLLIIGMMVLGPLMGAGQLTDGIQATEGQYPSLISKATDDDWVDLPLDGNYLPVSTFGDRWHRFKLATWWVFGFITVLSFYGGLRLLLGKDWSAVQLAKAVLWITGPGSLFIFGVIIPIMAFGKAVTAQVGFIGSFIGPFIASVIGATIWTAYLSRSKRVHNTYGADRD